VAGETQVAVLGVRPNGVPPGGLAIVIVRVERDHRVGSESEIETGQFADFIAGGADARCLGGSDFVEIAGHQQ